MEARKASGRSPVPAIEQELVQEEAEDVDPHSCRLPAFLSHLVCKLRLIRAHHGPDSGALRPKRTENIL